MINTLLNIHFVIQYAPNVVDNIPSEDSHFLSNVDRHTGSVAYAESNSYLLLELGVAWPMLKDWVVGKQGEKTQAKDAFFISILILQVHYADDEVH